MTATAGINVETDRRVVGHSQALVSDYVDSIGVRNQGYVPGVPLPPLMLELGHESLAVTRDYLADVRKPGEAKKAVADADVVPKPPVVETGTDGDSGPGTYGDRWGRHSRAILKVPG